MLVKKFQNLNSDINNNRPFFFQTEVVYVVQCLFTLLKCYGYFYKNFFFEHKITYLFFLIYFSSFLIWFFIKNIKNIYSEYKKGKHNLI